MKKVFVLIAIAAFTFACGNTSKQNNVAEEIVEISQTQSEGCCSKEGVKECEKGEAKCCKKESKECNKEEKKCNKEADKKCSKDAKKSCSK